MSHLFSKKKCFEKATWIGNFYTCPVCHRNIAIGFDNRIFPFPRYESCGDLLYKIPKQPAWYTEQSADELKDFIEEAQAYRGRAEAKRLEKMAVKNKHCCKCKKGSKK